MAMSVEVGKDVARMASYCLRTVVGRTATSLASHPLSFNMDIGSFRAFVGPLVSLGITRYVTRKVQLHS